MDPAVAVPTALGILLGAQLGPRLAGRLAAQTLRVIFLLMLLVFAVQMWWRAFT